MDADVVVIGGGPVGAALAMLLGRAGRRVIVLERSRFPRDKPCGEGLMPGGVAVLRRLGVDLGREGFPAVGGVRYRLRGGGSARGSFRSGPGFGVRRTRLDALLAERAAATPGVAMLIGCAALTASAGKAGARVETESGELRAAALVAADGIRSPTARWLGLPRAWKGPPRYALVGHLTQAGEQWDEIVVSLLGAVEVYAAPSGPGEVLVALLGARGSLRHPGRSVVQSYRTIVGQAHPELEDAPLTTPLRGAGPFRVAPGKVAHGSAFLVGDAAGFVDPLTGEGISSGLAQAETLARYLLAERAAEPGGAAAAYSAWHARQWRRRRLVAGVALALSGSATLARRALTGVGRRPAALQSLLEVNDGTRRLGSLSPRDWAALAGF